MSDLSITDARTKQELDSEKTQLESRVSTLQTRAGADTFIADKLATIEPELPKLSASMAFQAERICQRMRDEPDVVVSEHLQRLEVRKAEIERELKPVGEVKR